jgi:hypothetical protein
VGLGRYRIPLAKTIAIGGSIERRDHGPTRKFMALALKAEHFRNRSFADMPGPRRHVRFTAEALNWTTMPPLSQLGGHHGAQWSRPSDLKRIMEDQVTTAEFARRRCDAYGR